MSTGQPDVASRGVMAVREDVRALRPYRLPQARRPPADAIRLNQNEAPYDWPDEVKQEVAARVVAEPWHRYPGMRAEAVTRAIGELQGTPPDVVAPASGSNEALWAAFAAFAARGTVVMPAPTYTMARPLAVTAGARVVEVPLGPGFGLDAGRLLQRAHVHRAEAIYLACPNNPTGNTLDPDAVVAVIEGAPGAVILDEAYWEFTSRAWLEAVAQYPHLVVVRTFSKAMAGAGLRLGWLTAQEPVIGEIMKVIPPYSLNIFAQVAAPVLVAHRDVARAHVAAVAAERARLAGALERLGLRAYPSETNFVLFEPGFPPATVWERLADRGVLIRDVSSSPQLAACLRVSVGSPEDNGRFLQELAIVVGGLRGERA